MKKSILAIIALLAFSACGVQNGSGKNNGAGDDYYIDERIKALDNGATLFCIQNGESYYVDIHDCDPVGYALLCLDLDVTIDVDNCEVID